MHVVLLPLLGQYLEVLPVELQIQPRAELDNVNPYVTFGEN
jgi:hypothetical protein